MKTTNLIRIAYTTLVVFALSLAGNVNAQTYKTVSGALKVLGTSNLHNWEMNASSVPAEAQLSVKGSQVDDITSFALNFPVKNLKAKEDLMSSRAYKAMNADKYPTITFKLTSAEVKGAAVNANGSLTISGVTKPINIAGKVTENGDGTVSLNGSYKLKLTAFGIKPPSFMLGALKVGDDITVEYNLKLKK